MEHYFTKNKCVLSKSDTQLTQVIDAFCGGGEQNSAGA